MPEQPAHATVDRLGSADHRAVDDDENASGSSTTTPWTAQPAHRGSCTQADGRAGGSRGGPA